MREVKVKWFNMKVAKDKELVIEVIDEMKNQWMKNMKLLKPKWPETKIQQCKEIWQAKVNQKQPRNWQE